jgi:hypothetical protein
MFSFVWFAFKPDNQTRENACPLPLLSLFYSKKLIPFPFVIYKVVKSFNMVS